MRHGVLQLFYCVARRGSTMPAAICIVMLEVRLEIGAWPAGGLVTLEAK